MLIDLIDREEFTREALVAILTNNAKLLRSTIDADLSSSFILEVYTSTTNPPDTGQPPKCSARESTES